VAAHRKRVLIAVCTGVFLGAIDFYIVSIAVPDLLRSFSHAGITEISWVINGYAITYTAALLPAGGLADRFGRRRVFLLGLGTFLVSALACAAARSVPELIAARCVQGVGGGTITPLALTLILPQFPAERRGSAIGLWSATQSAAVAAGPSAGGALVAALGWRGVFLLQVPIGLAALAGAATALTPERPLTPGPATGPGAPAGPGAPQPSPAGTETGPGHPPPAGTPAGSGRPQPTAGRPPDPDLAGVLLLAGGIGLVALAIVQSHAWGALAWRTDLALGAGLVLGLLFVRRALTKPAPVIDLALLRNRAVRRPNGVMLLIGLVMFTLPVASVLFLTGVWGYSAARAGLAITPGPVMQTFAALAGGRLCNKFGPRALAVPACALLAASTLALALAAGPQSRYWAVIFPTVICGSAAVGVVITALSAAVVSGTPPGQLAAGTSMSVTARAAGAIVSLSAFALLLSALPGGTRTPQAFRLAWAGMTAIALVAMAAAWALGRPGDQVTVAPPR